MTVETTTRFAELMKTSGRDRPVSRAILALLRADSRVSRALDDALGRSRLTIAKFTILMELAAAEDQRLALCDIGRRLLKSAPNITGLIDRMEADGLIERARSERDRRVVIARITEKGWGALGTGAPAALAAEKEVTKALTRSELATLTRLLEALGT